MAEFQPPPTYALPILVDERSGTAQFNPIWLKWFLDLTSILNSLGGIAAGAHNSLTGLQGGTAGQFFHMTSAEDSLVGSLASGTYTPTLTSVANVTASTAYQAQYLRVGNTVLVSGKVDVDPTAAAATTLGISLPIASNFGAIEDCGGTAAAPGVAGQSAGITADAVNDRAQMQWVAVNLTNQPMFFIFAYQVI